MLNNCVLLHFQHTTLYLATLSTHNMSWPDFKCHDVAKQLTIYGSPEWTITCLIWFPRKDYWVYRKIFSILSLRLICALHGGVLSTKVVEICGNLIFPKRIYIHDYMLIFSYSKKYIQSEIYVSTLWSPKEFTVHVAGDIAICACIFTLLRFNRTMHRFRSLSSSQMQGSNIRSFKNTRNRLELTIYVFWDYYF